MASSKDHGYFVDNGSYGRPSGMTEREVFKVLDGLTPELYEAACESLCGTTSEGSTSTEAS